VKFYDYPEQMIRIASRTSVLSLMKLPDELTQTVILKSQFFERFMLHIKNQWVRADE
jgi:hypothetical protein